MKAEMGKTGLEREVWRIVGRRTVHVAFTSQPRSISRRARARRLRWDRGKGTVAPQSRRRQQRRQLRRQ